MIFPRVVYPNFSLLLFALHSSLNIVAPDETLEAGAVDEGVAVALNLVDGVVAFALTVADGVVLGPVDEHAQGPLGHAGVALYAGEGVGNAEDTAPVAYLVTIAGGHVEIGAGDVAFYLVVGLKDGASVSEAALAGANLAVVVGTMVGGGGNFAVRVVATQGVHPAVGGVHVEKVGVHGCGTAEPALGYGVLAVVAVAFF